MSLDLETRLRATLAAHIQAAYNLELPTLAIESPPRPELGEFAVPAAFELARRLKRAPRAIAQEVAAALALPEGFARVEVAGSGYLNFYVKRTAILAAAGGVVVARRGRLGKVIVEHTNINPNKAAHIGHLRNAVLGDTWVRLLRHRGEDVEVQNLQDNTGVQVADVVASFLYLQETPGEVGAAAAAVERALGDADLPFDYLCWNRYAAISQRYGEDPAALAEWRPAILHAIEAGGNTVAELGETIATAIATAHLRTMERIGVRYDVLPRESEILHLKLWQTAFDRLRGSGAIRLERQGKNAGCWVMERAGALDVEGEEETKVIVRSSGTVTYVGKDIAYQMWKFGLLPLEFGYRHFYRYADGSWAWTTATHADAGAPQFGRGTWVFNVIDVRQSYLQEVVAAGLRAVGAEQAAERSVHFSYEMVSLSAACAAELGYAAAVGEKRVDVSGRKGTGVKADDLIDRLEATTLAEVERRQPEAATAERRRAAHQIAVGALRYFLLKFTRTTLIAFDFAEALSFEGETGPYVQYAAVRAANILRKAGVAGEATDAARAAGMQDTGLWSLVWLAARLDAAVEQAIAAREPAHVAKYAFQLAQAFNQFYHHTPVLQETEVDRRALLLQIVAQVGRALCTVLELMGIEVPEAM